MEKIYEIYGTDAHEMTKALSLGVAKVIRITKKGSYKVKAKVKAAGKGYYNASAWKNVTITIKVK